MNAQQQRNIEIATIIQAQIGRMAFVMIGAKHFVAIEKGLQFQVGGNARGVKWIQIVLDEGHDSYNFKALGSKGQTLYAVDDTYVDSLHDLIESSTGMYTKL